MRFPELRATIGGAGAWKVAELMPINKKSTAKEV
jgi:hypothetical protein